MDYKMQEYINKKPRHIKQMEEKSRLFIKGRYIIGQKEKTL
jgi:hypothetical protein